MSTPEMFGRVAIAQTMRDVTPDLMDLLGAAVGAARGNARRAPMTAERNTSSGWPHRWASTAARSRCSGT